MIELLKVHRLHRARQKDRPGYNHWQYGEAVQTKPRCSCLLRIYRLLERREYHFETDHHISRKSLSYFGKRTLLERCDNDQYPVPSLTLVGPLFWNVHPKAPSIVCLQRAGFDGSFSGSRAVGTTTSGGITKPFCLAFPDLPGAGSFCTVIVPSEL